MSEGRVRRGIAERLRPRERVPGAWLGRELQTLTRVAETLVGGDRRLAVAAAVRLDLGLDPSLVTRLRVALWLMEMPLLGLLFGGSWRPFSRLDQAGRERELRRWATSRIRARRAGYQALKRVLAFQAHAEPTAAGVPNPRLTAMGYVPALEPVAADPTPILAFELPAPGGRGAMEIDADVVIVGSGAGGGVVARELAAAGRSVVVLEAGPLLTEATLPRDEVTAFDRLALDRGVTTTGDGGIAILAGTGVGGGTTINWATCLPPSAELRAEWAIRHGLEGFDGAEANRDLVLLERELGFAPPPSVPPKDRLLLDGAASLGLAADTTQRAALGCGDCGSCTFGCPRGAKRSTLRVHLADAWRHGARIVPDAVVRRILIWREQAQGAEADVRLADGTVRALRVRAPQVVVAAGALRTPGLLARSGVVHPSLGHFLRLHPVTVVAGLFEERIEMWRGTLQAARAFVGGGSEAAFTIESAPAHPGLIAFAMPWEGRARFAGLMSRAAHLAPLFAIPRDPDWGSIRQTRSGRDRIIYPIQPETARRLSAGAIAAAEIMRASGPQAIVVPGEPATAWSAGSAAASGVLPLAERDWTRFRRRLERLDFAPGRTLVMSAHQMGSARMGSVPSLHPVDPDGRVRWAPASIAGDRTIRGLYVADASLFPTALGINPMVTVMLLAKRTSRTVLAEATPAQ